MIEITWNQITYEVIINSQAISDAGQIQLTTLAKTNTYYTFSLKSFIKIWFYKVAEQANFNS